MISTTRRLFQGRKTAIFLLVSFISLITFSYISTIRSETFIYHYNHYKFSSKQVYVEAALSTSVDGPFDDSSLRVLCANTTWVPGIIFSCTSPKGDGAEMRNAVLTCVRFAIEGGGWYCLLLAILFPIFPRHLSPSCNLWYSQLSRS